MERILIIVLLWTTFCTHKFSVSASECMKRKYFEITVNYFGGVSINRTIKCDMYFQWTVSDYCCYDKYDRFERNPYCCYSETYKLVLAVGFICLVLLGCSFSIFLCWLYNLPHYLLYMITCGKFNLNDWTVKNKNSPYVDPSFYSGEPFWARGAEMHYPLKPMPPKVFYPAPPPRLKYRWDMAHGELPLFIVASRQFTRNPYSARPQDRHNTPQYHHDSNNNTESRRNSLSSNNEAGKPKGGRSSTDTQGNYSAQYNRRGNASGLRRMNHSESIGSASSRKSMNETLAPSAPPIDEADAAQELIEALKYLEEDSQKSSSPVEWKNEQASSGSENGTGGRQEIFIISDPRSNSVVGCSDTRRSGGLELQQIRPNTTGSLGTFDQYGNYLSLSQLGINDQQRLKIRGNPNNLGLSVYSMPGVHTAGVLTTVQNYHVVSSNLGNPMETILEDDSLDDAPSKDSDDNTPPTSSSSRVPANWHSHKSRAVGRALTRLNAERERAERMEQEKAARGRRRASTIAAVSTRRETDSPVTSASQSKHVLGPTPTAQAFVPFNPTLPGSLSENPNFDLPNGNEPHNSSANAKTKPRRNSVV